MMAVPFPCVYHDGLVKVLQVLLARTPGVRLGFMLQALRVAAVALEIPEG